MRKSPVENLPHFAIITIANYLNAKDTTQLALASKELFFTITAINLDKREHWEALMALSNQLCVTSTLATSSCFQSISYSTLAEFIISKNKKNTDTFVSSCATKIASENWASDYKSMTARSFVTESLQATTFFASLFYVAHKAMKKLDTPLIVDICFYGVFMFYSGVIATERVEMLPHLFSKSTFFSASQESTASLQNAIMPALRNLDRLKDAELRTTQSTELEM